MNIRHNILLIILDIICAAAMVGAIWIIGYKLPQNGVEAQVSSGMTTGADSSEVTAGESTSTSVSSGSQSGSLVTTDVKLDTTDWGTKFADKFTDTVVTTADSYTSPDISIHLTRNSYDSGIIDTSENGKHKKYGSKISYVLADIYIADIRCFQTAFADNTYGVGYSQKLSDMADSIGAVLAVNGDSYSNNRNKNNGTIIRNGVIYRAKSADYETCVLNWDGTMQIYQPGTIDEQTLIQNGAYQSWVFGPSLLNEDGSAKTDFITNSYIQESHPRTAIGYYEPGHYCLLLVDGRQQASRGMFLTEMSQLFESLGCKAAYNLDGGHCSFMYFNGSIANNPYKPEHQVSDGIFLTELAAAGKA
jgi:exopolysaccharide biosynthesis protein